ncbi:hypothetical protein [Oceanisphaera avium]|uniref:Uncharacterized protein n=1 Tax=Oceanisphaera avium TaxID=1903694 RepID=A0A1Y0D0V7_9GAMM|nr:hypothetical protein [Oceanisphaera avium]ART80874.1 hypothetical protein CBP12_12495 [Oceanisphaera avium]
MPHNKLDKNQTADEQAKLNETEQKRQTRRRLLTMIGAGIAGAYVAPTLFSIGQVQAGSWSSSYSYPSYSRPSYSRISRYDYRPRERVREYTEDPIRILEDAILGPQRR